MFTVDCVLFAVDCFSSSSFFFFFSSSFFLISVACVVFADVCAVSRSVGQLFTRDFVVPHQGLCHY